MPPAQEVIENAASEGFRQLWYHNSDPSMINLPELSQEPRGLMDASEAVNTIIRRQMRAMGMTSSPLTPYCFGLGGVGFVAENGSRVEELLDRLEVEGIRMVGIPTDIPTPSGIRSSFHRILHCSLTLTHSFHQR